MKNNNKIRKMMMKNKIKIIKNLYKKGNHFKQMKRYLKLKR